MQRPRGYKIKIGYKYLSPEEKREYHRASEKRLLERRKAEGLTSRGKVPVTERKPSERSLAAEIKCNGCTRVLPNTEDYFYKNRRGWQGRQCKICAIAYRNRWKLTAEEAQAFQDALNGAACWVCEQTTNLVIDHCHDTGRARGILCVRCNSLLGHLHDRSDLFQRMADYLRHHGK